MRARANAAHAHWIPPLPLAAGLAFQAASWLIAIAYGLAPAPGLAFAWVHAVALGWLTLTALSVLLHVVPEFTDLAWRGERFARAAVLAVLAGAVLLVVAFAVASPSGVELAAGVLVLAVAVYVTFVLLTTAQRAADRRSAAIARSLAVALSMLLLTAVLGGVLAGAYAAGDPRLLALAPAHALIGIGAWLTVLVSGVSAQTFRPMLGARSRWPRLHVVTGALLVFGPLIAAIGVPVSVAVLRTGTVIAGLGGLGYIVDALDIARRATTPHPPVRAFVVASVSWLAVACVCAVATVWGAPLGAAAVVAALIGWVGQMVNAHLHHLGVRVLTTLLRGDDDETRPWQVLDPRLTWTAFGFAQAAVLGLFAGVATGIGGAFVAGGLAGCCAIVAIVANVRTVRRNLNALPIGLI